MTQLVDLEPISQGGAAARLIESLDKQIMSSDFYSETAQANNVSGEVDGEI
ncbi:MAG: hypothetical protein AAF501_18735 [Pseudomonadota bacterium]